MFSEKDLIARLNNGESSDDIAKEFSDALNAAIKKKNDTSDAEIEYKAKLTDAQAILDAYNDYVKNWNPAMKLSINDSSDITAEEIVDWLNVLSDVSLSKEKFSKKINDTLASVDDLIKLFSPLF